MVSIKTLSKYFSNRYQSTKVRDTFSKWQTILKGEPQGPILDPLIFIIFINQLSLFVESTTLYNFADDNAMYSLDKNANIVIYRIRYDFTIISKWFYESYMVLNIDNSHF